MASLERTVVRTGPLGRGSDLGVLSLLPTPTQAPSSLTHLRWDRPPYHPLVIPVGLGVQGLIASLGLGVKAPTMAADVGDRVEAEVSPENFSETRVTAVTGWWGIRKERLTGRGLGGSWADEVWTSEDPLAGPVTHEQQGYGSYGDHRHLRFPHIQSKRTPASLSMAPGSFGKPSDHSSLPYLHYCIYLTAPLRPESPQLP